MPLAPAERRIKPPHFIELEGLRDLARLTCAFERVPLPVFAMHSPQGRVLGSQLDLFMGTPIFYYAKVDVSKKFLGYRNSRGVEEVTPVDSAATPGYTYAPVIAVGELPPIFGKGWQPRRRVDKFLSIRVEDLGSLARVASYKMIFEEPPLPLFYFSIDGKHVIGAFTRINEYEEASLFFYFLLPDSPMQNFLRYTSAKAQDAEFSGRIDEYGYVFIKIIRLAQRHPLVDV